MTDDFHDVLLSFVNAGVRFLVVGAHALAAHGVPRTTGDLDLEGEMLGVPVAFLGRESFLRNKRASGRTKDLRDIDALQ